MPGAPGGTMWLWSLLLSFPLSLAVSGLHEPEAPEGDGELHCGPQGLRFTVQPPGLGTGAPPALIVWDDHGQLYQLQNDSGCGTQVMAGPGSSMVLEASYGSCYVTELGTQHVMPVGVEGADAAGHKTVEETRLLKCPLGLPGADLCDSVPERDRLPCLPSPAAQEDCKRLGCCYNPSGKSCHYGNTVTTHCTQDGHFAIAVARDVTAPPLLVRSVHLASQNSSECDPVTATQAFALFRFPFTACGTTRRVTGDQAVYEVELSAARDVSTWSRGSVTRDSIFRLRVRCTYAVSSNALPVTVQVFLLPPPLPGTQPGPLTLELRVAKDKNYSSYYSVDDYPVVKLLRDPIYVEVSIRHRTDPNLGMLLQCWATPGPDPRHRLQWALLVRGCPYTGDNYQTQLIPVQEDAGLPFPSHYQRFSISTFSFVDSGARRALGGPVYLHCSVSICQPEGTLSCVTCPVARRRRSSGSFHNSTASISGQGPLILLQATTDASENLRKFSGPPVDARALWVASLSGTFIVGILLVSYLAIKKRR